MKIGSLVAVDAVGTLAVASCVGIGVWYGLLNSDSATGRIGELSAEVRELDNTLAQAEAALNARQAAYHRLQAELGDRELLPEGTPIERDLGAISDLTRRNHLELIEFTPAGSQRYPGVLELRYRLTARGSFADYARFLRDFEASSSWADITHLKFESPDARTSAAKPGELMVSLYSAIQEEAGETTTQ